jgi:hypothetical protein
MVGADIPGRRHLWVLAVRAGSIRDGERFADILDTGLLSRNADYAAFRAQGRINRPEVVTVDEGVIYSWSKEIRGKLGGQSKVPHIDPTPDGKMAHDIVTYAVHRSAPVIEAPELSP